MQRRDIETTKSSRGGILAIDAANADKRTRVEQTKKRLSTLREPISSARPLFAKTSQKLKSFMLALGDERLYLDHLECCEAYDHDILAERPAHRWQTLGDFGIVKPRGGAAIRCSDWFGLRSVNRDANPKHHIEQQSSAEC